MLPLRENSSAAAFLLMMLTLDMDGVRKKVEFDMVSDCVRELADDLVDGDAEMSAEALLPILNIYYDDIDGMTSDDALHAYMDDAIGNITDDKLRGSLFELMVRIAMSDNELHDKENAFLRRTSLAWKLPFNGAA